MEWDGPGERVRRRICFDFFVVTEGKKGYNGGWENTVHFRNKKRNCLIRMCEVVHAGESIVAHTVMEEILMLFNI